LSSFHLHKEVVGQRFIAEMYPFETGPGELLHDLSGKTLVDHFGDEVDLPVFLSGI
jgi:hypothetical protein